MSALLCFSLLHFCTTDSPHFRNKGEQIRLKSHINSVTHWIKNLWENWQTVATAALKTKKRNFFWLKMVWLVPFSRCSYLWSAAEKRFFSEISNFLWPHLSSQLLQRDHSRLLYHFGSHTFSHETLLCCYISQLWLVIM